MSVKSTENFLGAFEKNFSSKSEVLSQYSSLISSSLFQNLNFLLFLTYNLTGGQAGAPEGAAEYRF
eukprot:UN07115